MHKRAFRLLLRQGVTPDKLALRLNMPAIQAVNYLLTPVQLLLIIPLLRFGEWIAHAPRFPITLDDGLALLSRGVPSAVKVLGTAIFHASLGWIVLAPFAAFALYRALVPAFRRIAPTKAR